MKSLIVAVLIFSGAIFAQELNCTVTVNMDNIPTSFRDRLSDFKNNVESYLNKTRFVGDSWEGPRINCSFDIFFSGAPNDINFSAQVAITSQRDIYNSTNKSLMLKVNDNSWNFNYQKGQALYFNQSSFDPLTSFLDFYAYVIIGLDMDSYVEMGGSEYFLKASAIASYGAASQYNTGWTLSSASYNRRKLVEDLNNDAYRAFREGEFDYYYGIDVFSLNKELGYKYIVKLVDAINASQNKIDLSSVLMRTFFNSKSEEIISMLKDYPDRYDVFLKLKKLDPAHSSKYDDAMNY
jgi:Domain of unknown function (DUF4835)